MLVRLSKDVEAAKVMVGNRLTVLRPGVVQEVGEPELSRLLRQGVVVKGEYPDIRNDAIVEVDLRGVPREALSAEAERPRPVKPPLEPKKNGRGRNRK